MKLYAFAMILFSAMFAAQETPKEWFKKDSLKLPKRDKLLQIPESKSDTSITKRYKMPVAKPKNIDLYTGLKSTKTDTAVIKIPNLFDAAKPAKLAVKPIKPPKKIND